MIFSETLVPQKIFWWYTLHTIFIWEFGTTESSESPEECESSAIYINPNRFHPGVREVYKRAGFSDSWSDFLISQIL